MADLTDFGLEAPEPDDAEADADANADDAGRPYRNGRCPAIATSTRTRCGSSVSRMNATGDYCGTHGRGKSEPWSIHDPAEKLILVTGEFDAMSLDDLDPDGVDFDLDLILEAVGAVDGWWDHD